MENGPGEVEVERMTGRIELKTAWIPFEMSLPEKPEVQFIARRAKMEVDTVIGKLMRFWAWANSHSENGLLPRYFDLEMIVDRFGGGVVFWEAALDCGWLVQADGQLLVPNAERWMMGLERKRAQAAERKRRQRAIERTAAGVTCDSRRISSSLSATSSSAHNPNKEDKEKKEKTAAPVAPPSSKPTKRAAAGVDTWLTGYGDTWRERYGGAMPYGKFATDLKRVQDDIGRDQALGRWRNYVAATPGRFANAAQFAATHGEYRDDGSHTAGHRAGQRAASGAATRAAGPAADRAGGGHHFTPGSEDDPYRRARERMQRTIEELVPNKRATG